MSTVEEMPVRETKRPVDFCSGAWFYGIVLLPLPILAAWMIDSCHRSSGFTTGPDEGAIFGSCAVGILLAINAAVIQFLGHRAVMRAAVRGATGTLIVVFAVFVFVFLLAMKYRPDLRSEVWYSLLDTLAPASVLGVGGALVAAGYVAVICKLLAVLAMEPSGEEAASRHRPSFSSVTTLGAFSFRTAWCTGLEAFKLHWPVAVLGVIVWAAAYQILSLLLLLVPLVAFIVQIALAGGLCALSLNVVDNEKPSIRDIFGQIANAGKWLVLVLVLSGSCVLATAPFFAASLFVAYVVDRVGIRSDAAQDVFELMGATAMVSTFLFALAALVWIAARWQFIGFAAAEGATWREALETSAFLTKGRRTKLLLNLVLLNLLSSAGMVCFGVGGVVSVPLAATLFAATYRTLKPRPGAQHGIRES